MMKRSSSRRLCTGLTSLIPPAGSPLWRAAPTATSRCPTCPTSRRARRQGATWSSAMTPANVPDTPALSIRSGHNENQNEQNYYGVVTYQKSAGDFDYQVSAFGRRSEVTFHAGPDRRPLFQRRGQRSGSRPLFRRLARRQQLSSGRNPYHPGGRVVAGHERFQNNTSTTVFNLDGSRRSDDPDQHPGQPSPLRYFRRRLCAGRMEAGLHADPQLRRALRCLLLVLRR